MCRNPLNYFNCIDLKNEKLSCLDSNNGECNLIKFNECRDLKNSTFLCRSLIDGMCIEGTTNNCVESIPSYNCRDSNTNYC